MTHIFGIFVCFDKIWSDMNIKRKCLLIKRTTNKQAYALRDHLALVIKSQKKNKVAQRSDHAEKPTYQWIFALNLSDFCFFFPLIYVLCSYIFSLSSVSLRSQVLWPFSRVLQHRICMSKLADKRSWKVFGIFLL